MWRMGSDINAGSGVIAIDKHGNFGIAFSVTKAVWASKKNNELQSGMRFNEFKAVGPDPL